MRLPDRRRGGALGVSVVAAALTLVVVRYATARYERALAERSAATIAAYLSIAAPADQSGSDYDLAQLLVQARALAALLGSARVEVYHGTAPLVQAVAPPLLPAELDRLRREETSAWSSEAALAPLLDREGWAVVGGVRVPRSPLAVRWLDWGLPAILLISIAFAVASARATGEVRRQQRALRAYAAAAMLAGCVAYVDVRIVAKRATDRWLTQTGALVQEATTHAVGRLETPAITSIVRGGTLAPAGIAGWDSKPHRLSRGAVAAIVVRIGAGRWAELRTAPAEAATGLWLLGTLGLALLGPAAMWFAATRGR